MDIDFCFSFLNSQKEIVQFSGLLQASVQMLPFLMIIVYPNFQEKKFLTCRWTIQASAQVLIFLVISRSIFQKKIV